MYEADSGLPTTPRLATKKLGLAAALVGAALCGMVFMSLWQRQQRAVTPPPPPLPPVYEVSGEVDTLQQLQLKTSWAGVDRTPPAPPVAPPPPDAGPPPAPLFAAPFAPG